jgi:hypothetical protein
MPHLLPFSVRYLIEEKVLSEELKYPPVPLCLPLLAALSPLYGSGTPAARATKNF